MQLAVSIRYAITLASVTSCCMRSHFGCIALYRVYTTVTVHPWKNNVCRRLCEELEDSSAYKNCSTRKGRIYLFGSLTTDSFNEGSSRCLQTQGIIGSFLWTKTDREGNHWPNMCRVLSISVHNTRGIGKQHHLQTHAFGNCVARKFGRLCNWWITLHQDMVSHRTARSMQLTQMLAWHIITTTHTHEYSNLCRGEQFRTAFRGLGDVRSLMKKTVSVMALTATATRETRDIIFSTVGMTDVFIVSKIPEKENIIYSITKTTSIPAVFSQYVEELRVRRVSFPRVLIFCRTISDCANIYEFFCQKLGREFTHPMGAQTYHIFALWTCTQVLPHPRWRSKLKNTYRKETVAWGCWYAQMPLEWA